jgi:hypothetical protein
MPQGGATVATPAIPMVGHIVAALRPGQRLEARLVGSGAIVVETGSQLIHCTGAVAAFRAVLAVPWEVGFVTTARSARTGAAA